MYILRNRNNGLEFSEMQDAYLDKKARDWLKKYNYDLKRHTFLEQKLDRINKQLALVEDQRFK